MTILIKGMDMPKSCEDCPLVEKTENYYGDIMSRACNLIYKGYTSEAPKGGRREDCPLIEVPTSKQGTWIAGENGHYHCSVCGHIVDKIYTCSDLSRLGYFCRNCGAEMDGMLF